MASNDVVAIVTGGAQGLGAAICIALLERGYKVCVADIQEVKGNAFVKEQRKAHGDGNVLFSLCDVTKEDDHKRTFEAVIKEFGKVDLLVNNAGIILEQNPRKCIDINLIGTIFGCQTAIKYMGKSHGGGGGMVINVSSMAGFIPHSALPVYIASKHGIVGLTRSYGLPYHEEREGIIFAALCPFFIDTDLLKKSLETTLVPGLDFTKVPNLLSTEYVAQGAMKLLDDRINGSTLAVTHQSGYGYIGYQKEFENIPIV